MYKSALGKRCSITLKCSSQEELSAIALTPNVGGLTIPQPEQSRLFGFRKSRDLSINMPCCVEKAGIRGSRKTGSDTNFQHEAQHAVDFCDGLYRAIEKQNQEHKKNSQFPPASAIDYIETEIRGYQVNLIKGLSQEERKKALQKMVRGSIESIHNQINARDDTNKPFDTKAYDKKFNEVFDKSFPINK